MHSLLFITIGRKFRTSAATRALVYRILSRDPHFAREDGAGICDWFVIGGRWSGLLSQLTWAKQLYGHIDAVEQSALVAVSATFYADAALQAKQLKLAKQVETLYQASLPKKYQGTGMSYRRDPWLSCGYHDDAMMVNHTLYDRILAPYAEQARAEDEQGGLLFWDLDGEPVTPRFIRRKWLVLVDYHR